jgi:hypothetical protein
MEIAGRPHGGGLSEEMARESRRLHGGGLSKGMARESGRAVWKHLERPNGWRIRRLDGCGLNPGGYSIEIAGAME